METTPISGIQLETAVSKIEPLEIKNGSPSAYDILGCTEINFRLPIQKGNPTAKKDGLMIEELILVCIDQLEHFQQGPFACGNNEDTLRHLRDALNTTRARQYERTLRGVQGQMQR